MHIWKRKQRLTNTSLLFEDIPCTRLVKKIGPTEQINNKQVTNKETNTNRVVRLISKGHWEDSPRQV